MPDEAGNRREGSAVTSTTTGSSVTPEFIAPADAPARDVVSPFGGSRHIREFYGVADEIHPGPQAFLLTLPPSTTTRAHYHRIDQFQVLFGAPGAYYARHAMGDIVIHYADAYSTYGPFGSGPEAGIEYFSLREQGDNLVAHMPEYKAMKIRKSRRNLEVEVDPTTFTVPDGQCMDEELFADPADQLRAGLLRIGTGATFPGTVRQTGGGAYYCVLHGEGSADGRTIAAKSLCWVASGAPRPQLKAGSGGLAVVALQFPSQRTGPVVGETLGRTGA